MAVALLYAMMLFADLSAEASREVATGECKPLDRNEIIVCGSRKRDERYRLPDRTKLPFDPAGQMKSVMNERVGWTAEGDVGNQSCSAVGPGGWTGCMVKGWKVERDQTQWGKNGSSRGR
ncbi:MAG: hypothetical protein H0V46_06330 [Sphingomonas sp.]|nr:hypothetical protein [Sphingomonas sp.]